MMRRLSYAYLVLVFAALGMYWMPDPITGSLRLFQLLFLGLLAMTAVNARALREIALIINNNVVFFVLFLSWMLIGLAGTISTDTNWEPAIVLRFSFYFISGLAIVGTLNVLEQDGRAPRFAMFGWAALAGFLAGVLVFSGLSPQALIPIVATAIQTGNPDLIIFNIFGSRGLLSSEDVEFAGGLRHTVSMVFVVAALLGIFDMKMRGMSVLNLVLVLGLILVVFIMQSRSSWLCLALGIGAVLVQESRNPRYELTGFIKIFVILAACTALFVKLVPLILVRLGDERSLEARSDYLSESASLFSSYFFEPVPRVLIEGSPHNFVFDAALSAGLYGFVVAGAIVLYLVFLAVKTWRFQYSAVFVALLLIFVIRSFTIGSGVPGPGTLIGLMFFFWYQKAYVLPVTDRVGVA